jgi:gliding motility-associated-like protein
VNLIKFLSLRAFVLFLSGFAFQVNAQVCECLNCPLSLPAAGIDTCYTREFILNINGASNNDLADPVQGVCAVNVHFQHNYVWSLEMYLVSPNGDTLRLTGPSLVSGYASTALSSWDISFIQSQYPPNPDPGFNGTWSNDQLWEVFKKYTGQYHPSEGSLEDFDQGPVNGQWKIILKNCTEIEAGNFINFSIVFCDETGIDCSCQAYAGRLTDDDPWRVCLGDNSLDLDLHPTFYGSPPDSAIYDYTYLLSYNGILQSYTDTVNLISAPSGKYEICGFSFDKEDLDSFPDPDGILTIPLLKDLLFSDTPPGCGDVSNGCLTIFIGEPLPVQVIDTTLCSGKCVTLGLNTYCVSTIVRDTFQAFNGCDSIVELRLTILPPQSLFIQDTICQGEFYVVGTNFYNQTGLYQNLLINPNTGCDSLVILDLFVINLDAIVALPNMLGCSDTIANLNGSFSTFNVLQPNIFWTASAGGTFLSGQDDLVAQTDQPGFYTLHINWILANGKVCADSGTVQVISNPLRPELSGPLILDYCSGSSINLPALPIIDLNNLGGQFTFHTESPVAPANQVGPIFYPLGQDTIYVHYEIGWCMDSLLVGFNEIAAPFVELLPFVAICNDDGNGAFNTFIQFDTLVINANLIGSWVNTDMAPVSGTFPLVNFANVPGPASYTFTWTSVNAQAPCTNIQSSIEIFVENCACPSVATQHPGPFCISDGNVFLPDYENTIEPGHWTIIQDPGNVDPAFILNDSLIVSQKDTGLYKIVFQLDQAPPPGCPDTSAHWFNINSPPSSTVIASDTVCNSGESGTYPVAFNLMMLITAGDTTGNWIDLSNSGAILTGSWVDFNGVPPGNYPFIYTTGAAQLPCPESSYTTLITVLDCACPPLVLYPSDTLCNDQSFQILQPYVQQGGAGSWSILNTPPGGNPAQLVGKDSLIANGADPGVYVLLYQLAVTPGGACIDTGSMAIFLLEAAYAQLQPADTVCNINLGGGFPTTLDLNTLIKAGDQSGFWVDLMGSGATGNMPVLSFDGVAPGQYLFRYVTGNAVYPCTNKNYDVLITVLDCNCPLFSNATICNDEPIFDLNTLHNSGLSVVWQMVTIPPGSNPATINNQSVITQKVDPGLYQIKAIFSNSPGSPCPDSALVDLIILEAPVLILRQQNVICNAPGPYGSHLLWLDSLILTGLGSGTWIDLDNSGASGLLPNLDFTGVPAGNYRFVYNMQAGAPCMLQLDTLSVTVLTCVCPLVTPTPLPIICNSAIDLDLTLYSLGLAPGTWDVLQSPPGTSPVTIIENTLIVQNRDAGMYTLVYSLDQIPPQGCPDTAQVLVQIEQQPEAGQLLDTIHLCLMEPVNLLLTNFLSNADPGGQWAASSTNPIPLIGIDPSTGQWTQQGIFLESLFSITYITAATNSCPADTAIIPIEVHGLPAANAGSDQSLGCVTPTVSLGDAQAPGGNEIEYQWKLNGLPVGSTPQIMADQPGLYFLEVVNTLSGCSARDTAEVGVGNFGPIAVNLSINHPTCTGVDGSLNVLAVSGGLMPYLYQLNAQAAQTAPNFVGLAEGLYNLRVEDLDGCFFDTTLSLIPAGAFNVSLGPDLSVTIGSTLSLNAELSGNVGNVTQVSWSPLGIQCTDCLEQQILIDQEILVTVLVENQAGCQATDELFISVVAAPFRFYVPNAFSPDADGINDRFTIYGDQQLEQVATLEIYDRWGNALFKAINFLANDTNLGWDGTYNGKKMDPGVYVYHAVLRLDDGQTRAIKGAVNLIR